MKKKIANVTIVIALVIAIILSVKSNLDKENALKRNGVLLNGIIVDVAPVKNYSFACKFIYNGNEFVRNTKSTAKKSTYFLGQSFPLIYSPEKDIIQILITPKDFNDYGISFPDSLNWVLEDKY